MLSLLYDSGARVQELADLRVGDLRLDFPAQVKLTGKGRKTKTAGTGSPSAGRSAGTGDRRTRERSWHPVTVVHPDPCDPYLPPSSVHPVCRPEKRKRI